MKYCSINGETITEIEVTDRGLAYGDGLFTTAKVSAGQILLLDEHIDRLMKGCKQLNFQCPSDTDMRKQLTTVANNFSSAVLKVIITAGSGGRGYSRLGLTAQSSNFIIMVFDFPLHYGEQASEGITLGISHQKIAISPMLGGLKHLNRLEQVLLRNELDVRDEDDLIVCNTHGDVIEATSANLFYWLDNSLCTPELSYSGVNGLMRQRILNNHDDIIIKKTTLNDLKRAEAMFICNCVMGIMPIRRFDARNLPINLVAKLMSTLKV
jgi:4-amino-4-deoxychorismate lyase